MKPKDTPKPEAPAIHFHGMLDVDQWDLLEGIVKKRQQPGINTVQKLLRFVIIPEWHRVVVEGERTHP